MKRTFKRTLNIPEAVFDICCFSKKHVKQQKPRKAPCPSNKDQKAVKPKSLCFPSFFSRDKKEVLGNSKYQNCRNKASCGEKLPARIECFSIFFSQAKPNQTKPGWEKAILGLVVWAIYQCQGRKK